MLMNQKEKSITRDTLINYEYQEERALLFYFFLFCMQQMKDEGKKKFGTETVVQDCWVWAWRLKWYYYF